MRLKGKRSNIEPVYDAEVGCFTEGTGSYRFNCGGGGGGTTSTVASPEQRALLLKKMGYADDMEALGVRQFYNRDTLADQDFFTNRGLEAQADAAGRQGDIAATTMQRFQDAMSYDPLSDPNTERYLDAVTNPLTEQFTEETLPGLSTAAMKAGAFGGDRADVLKNQAFQDYAQTMGDTRAKALQTMVDSNRQRQSDMISQLPTISDSILGESQTLRDVGAAYEDRAQAEIDADRERFEFGQEAPRDSLKEISNMLSGINFGTVSKQSGGK